MRATVCNLLKALTSRPHGGLLLLFCAPLSADYQTGLDAYLIGDYSKAMTEWKAVASQQPEKENLAIYRESLYAIGMLYWQGDGVEQSYDISAVWLKQAAEINHPGAQTKLGYLYTAGLGVPQNYGEAVKWFQMAAAQGDPDAKHNLDVLFEKGLIPAPALAGEDDALAPPVEQAPVVEETAAETRSASMDKGEDWILRQQPGHYTIQVIALSAPDKLQAFITENPDWSPFAIYKQTRYENPLWVLVQGVYADVATAREAAASFPGSMQKRSDLWIRKFEMVQRLVE
jgi:TPR repeat protein